MMKHVPNCITLFRIAATVMLLFISPEVLMFYIIYTLAGISDVLDGTIARKYHLESDLGSKLDSVADISYYVVMVYKMFPKLSERLPKLYWYWIILILAVRCISYILSFRYEHTFASLHTILNKLTAFSVFLVPFVMLTSFLGIYSIIVAVIASISAIYELGIHLRRKELPANS